MPYRGNSLIRNSPRIGPYGGPRGTSLTRNSPHIGSYGGPRGGGLFLMSEVPLYTLSACTPHSGPRRLLGSRVGI